MERKIVIDHTTVNDMDFIFQLFDWSIRYQEEKGYNVWRNYDQNALRQDSKNKNQYKLTIDGQIAMVFSLCYTDKLIWRDRDQNDAVYIHRAVVNPAFKGQRLFGQLLEWVIGHAQEHGLSFVRMDTWADNPSIIAYYTGFGMQFIENFITPDSPELPVHNRNLPIALLETEISK